MESSNIDPESCAKTTQNDAGLINLENKCLSEKLQAVRQAVLALSSSAEWIDSGNKHFDVQLPFIKCSMTDLFEFITSIRKEIPTAFTTSSPRSSEVYNNSQQTQRDSSSQSPDAWEYCLQFLLKTLTQRYTLAQDFVIEREILRGFYSSSLKCLSCLHESDIKNQEFQDLELSLTETYTINDALTLHFAREPFDRTCEKCKHAEVQQTFSLTQQPYVLCIRGKIHGTINIRTRFSPEIDLSQHFRHNEDFCMLQYRLVSMVLQSKDDHHRAILCAKDGSYTEYSHFNERVISNDDVTNAEAYLALYELNNSTPIGISYNEDFNSGSLNVIGSEIYSNDERSLDTSTSGLGTSASPHSFTIESDEIMQPTPIPINFPNINTNSGDDSSNNDDSMTQANEPIYDSSSACSTSSQTSPSKIEKGHKKTLRTSTSIQKTKPRETFTMKAKENLVKFKSSLNDTILVSIVQEKSATKANQNQNHTAVGSRNTVSTIHGWEIDMDTTAVGSRNTALTIDGWEIGMVSTAVGSRNTASRIHGCEIEMDSTDVGSRNTASTIDGWVIEMDPTAVGSRNTASRIHGLEIEMDPTAVGSRNTASTIHGWKIEMDTTAVGSTKSAATKNDWQIEMDTNDPNDGKMYEIFSLESGADKAKTEQILQNYGYFIKELSIHPLEYFSYAIDLVVKYCSGTLESLSLYDCKIPEARTEQFLFTNLRKLYIENVNDGQIGFFMENRFSSNLEHFECEDDNHKMYNFEKFVRYHPNLKKIIIKKSTHLVTLLPAMAEFCKQLEELEIKVTENSRAAKEALKSLRTLSHLKKLTFHCPKKENMATFINLLNSFESLKTLELHGAYGNREFIKSVSKLKNVRTLELIQCCKLRDLNPLAQLSQLTELTIAITDISDIELDLINLLNSLYNLKTLKLYIKHFEIDKATYSMMRNINAARPELKIYGDCKVDKCEADG